jgi:hypothetical protein
VDDVTDALDRLPGTIAKEEELVESLQELH